MAVEWGGRLGVVLAVSLLKRGNEKVRWLVGGWLAGWWMAMKGNVVVVVLFILVRRPGVERKLRGVCFTEMAKF